MRRPILLSIAHPGVNRPKIFFNWYMALAIAILPVLMILAFAAPSYEPISSTTLKVAAIPKDAEYMPDEIVVKFKSTAQGQFSVLPEAYLASNTEILAYKDFGLQSTHGIGGLKSTVVYRTKPGSDVKAMMEEFSNNPAVEYAEPNYIVRAFRQPTDTFYNQGRQYYLDRVNMPTAWDITTGSNQVVVAVVDSGVRNNNSLTLDPFNNNTYGAYLPVSIAGGPPLRSPDGPAPPLPTGITTTDPCYYPQPTPYPTTVVTPAPGPGTPTAAPTAVSNVACAVSPLYGGLGVNDLKGKVLYQQGISTVADCQPPRWNPRSPECVTDYNGHGTAVAGIIAANGNDGYGMAGVNWKALILPVRALDYTGAGAESWVGEGITYAANFGARIINLSLGTTVNSKAMADAVKYAQSKGSIIVAASGNAANGVAEYPAAYPGVIAVGATDQNNQVAKFSSFGPWVSVVAPGSQILTTNINWPGTEFGKGDPFLVNDATRPEADRGDFTVVSGTSFSAPIVSGIIGLMLAVKPDLSADQARSLLEGTATDLSGNGRDDREGYGLVNAGAALQALVNGDLTPNRNSKIQGFVRGANIGDVVMSLEPGQVVRNLVPGTAVIDGVTQSVGQYSFDNMGAGQYLLRMIIPKASRILGPVTVNLDGSVNTVVNVNFYADTGQIIAGPGATSPTSSAPPNSQGGTTTGSIPSQSIFFNRLAPVASTSTLYYFTETGHTLKGTFKQYWDSNGGLPVFGFPISEEFQEVSPTDGKLYSVQYFERNRFEYHPENAGTRFEVLLGLLGSESTRGRNFSQATPVASTTSLWYFGQTGHTLSGRFLDYWNRNGGLMIFGYPISEPVLENGLQVQYFERNRFEYHPENAGSKYDVLLGLLGNDLARNRGYLR